MKCIAAIEVDLEQSPIGTSSRLADDLVGVPVLTRTIRQILNTRRIERLFVICPGEQMPTVRELLPGEADDRIELRETRVPNAPYRHLVRTARKWSLDGWRGGLGGTCCLDEYTRSDELAILAHEQKADALFCAPAASPLLDSALADEMIRHTEETVEESRLTFVQAPPGLAGTVYRGELLMEMGQKGFPPGFVLSYKPGAPQMDLAHKSCCYNAPAAVRHAAGRLIVDTRRAWEAAHALLNSGQATDAESVGRWLIERDADAVPDLPREVEIELTTDDQLPNALLRPRGVEVGHRGPIDLAVVEKIAAELAAYDDSLAVLGGFGEPLLHPRFGDILTILRSAGIYGVAVRTNGLALDDARITALIQNRVDVINVVLDAWTPQLYESVQGSNRLAEVRDNINRLNTLRSEQHSVAPILVPEMTKANETLHELDAFFDGWTGETGCACISGYSHYAGQRADRAVIRMSPPTRVPCRRIRHRLTVLADGRVPLCDQDFTGRHAFGDRNRQSLRECWNSQPMNKARLLHRDGQFDALPLCAACDEWHRP